MLMEQLIHLCWLQKQDLMYIEYKTTGRPQLMSLIEPHISLAKQDS